MIFYLHGLGCSKEFFIPLLSSLEPEKAYCAFDIMGFGETIVTDRLHGSELYSFKNVALLLAELMDQLAVQSCKLVLHSMTSAILPYLTNAQTQMIDRIVLLDPSLEFSLEEWSSQIVSMTDEKFFLYVDKLKAKAMSTFNYMTSSRYDIKINQFGENALMKMDKSALRLYSQQLYTLTRDELIILAVQSLAEKINIYVSTDRKKQVCLAVSPKTSCVFLKNASHFLMLDLPDDLKKLICSD